MRCFIDTSGYLAVANPDDADHRDAAMRWRVLIERADPLFTSNYVVVETVALLHHRYGVAAVRRFTEDILPVVALEWVDHSIHGAALGAVIAGGWRGPSLVDCVSFEMMRRERTATALAYDRHFTERGYALPEVPNPTEDGG